MDSPPPVSLSKADIVQQVKLEVDLQKDSRQKRVCNEQAVNRVSRLPNRDATDGSYRNLSLARTLRPSSLHSLELPSWAERSRVGIRGPGST